jgi:corticosteroid 11-beta-dehydrogenase isozyme 1
MALASSRVVWLSAAAAVVACWLLAHSTPATNLLAGRRVVITGASMGIGKQLALLYCGAGASVLLVSRSEARLSQVARQCQTLIDDRAGLGGEASSSSSSRFAPVARVVAADLSMDVEATGRAVIDAAVRELGGLDVLVLNHIMSSGGAAYSRGGWLADPNMTTLRATLETNTLSYIALATAALPALRASSSSSSSSSSPPPSGGGGSIIVVSSLAGKMGLPAVAAYSASKHALHGFFDSLRHDLSTVGSLVSVTTAVLGSINTTNALRGVGDALPNVAWAPAHEAAAAIAWGGAMRRREVYYPALQLRITLALRPFFPDGATGPPLRVALLGRYAVLAGTLGLLRGSCEAPARLLRGSVAGTLSPATPAALPCGAPAVCAPR